MGNAAASAGAAGQEREAPASPYNVHNYHQGGNTVPMSLTENLFGTPDIQKPSNPEMQRMHEVVHKMSRWVRTVLWIRMAMAMQQLNQKMN
jgi:hypothetical protein